ncbi:MAG: signal peptide peptidase SppA [Muribaculaceae bacterium]|nr:signal peptide peptidase SppA [Muribaculaceae bacterium]
MLKKFFLVVCGSFVGVFLALIFFTLSAVVMSFVIFGSMSSSMNSAPKVEKNSILYIDLEGTLEERDAGINTQFMSLMSNKNVKQSLLTLIKGLEIAKNDNKIKGVYLDCRGMSSGMSSLYELREAIKDFKQSKKFVYAFGDEAIMQSDYYLASVADSIFLNPEGMVDIHGLGAATPYMKKLLDKVGVEMQVVRVGTFKSAVEPYMLEQMSDANRVQQEHYLGSLWGVISSDMAKDRAIDTTKFNALTDSVMATMSSKELLSNKLVDKICYRSEFEDKLRAMTDVEKEDDLKLVSADELVASNDDPMGTGSKVVAVLYATGEINSGDGGSSNPMSAISGDAMYSETMADQIRELQYDEDVKGLVLRVNSPGGSAFGSEEIWKALEDFKASGKPLAVSMSDYAASGGYYISSGAQRIFAEPLTITGSIGIFGIIPNASNFINNTLGVNFEEVSTNPNAIAGAYFKPLTEQQRSALQHMVERGYDTFTGRCAMGRKVSQDSIKSIGEGRVWDAVTAQKIGLVDELGGLGAAVKWVAKQAKLKDGDYSVVDYPNAEMSFMDMLNSMGYMKVESDMQKRMGLFYSTYEQLQAILGRDRVLCLMEPVEINF